MPRPVVVLEVDVPPADVDAASGLLWTTGAVNGIAELISAEPAIVVLRVGLEPDADVEALVAELADRWPVRTLTVDADRWVDDARRQAEVVRAGSRIVLVPSGSGVPTPIVADSDIVVRLDAGAAFGSGSHPTTRLALAALEASVGSGMEVLDVGCGSGVLAIAAVRLGAASAVGIDLDPAAIVATRANAAANGVGGRLHVSGRPLSELSTTFDLVVANITAGTLLDLAPDLVARARSGATMLLTGILDRRADEVCDTFAALGCTETNRATDDGWTLVRFGV